MVRIFDYFKYSWKDFKEERVVRSRYYQSAFFSKVDRDLCSSYLFKNPYKISKHYLKKRKEKEIHIYGETPLTTLEKIGKESNLKPSDQILDLGCGRGRSVFFLNHYFGCSVIGIERIDQFVKIAQNTTKKHKIEGVSFINSDMLEVSLSKANFIYLFGTALSEKEIKRLIVRLKTCSKGTRIVTISYPLTDYDLEQVFVLEKTFRVSFPWGETEAYLQTIQ